MFEYSVSNFFQRQIRFLAPTNSNMTCKK